MRKLEFGIRRIQRSLKKVENDRFTPAVITPEVSNYFIDLANVHSNDHSTLGEFLTSLPVDSFRNELLIQIIPESIRGRIFNLRVAHEDLEREKEIAIENQNFDSAAALRDRQVEMVDSIRQIVEPQRFAITPGTIQDTLESLGWSEE